MANKHNTPGRATPVAMTVDEAAHYLRLSRSSIYRLFQTGDLKIRKVAGRTLVRRQDLDDLLSRS